MSNVQTIYPEARVTLREVRQPNLVVHGTSYHLDFHGHRS